MLFLSPRTQQASYLCGNTARDTRTSVNGFPGIGSPGLRKADDYSVMMVLLLWPVMHRSTWEALLKARHFETTFLPKLSNTYESCTKLMVCSEPQNHRVSQQFDQAFCFGKAGAQILPHTRHVRVRDASGLRDAFYVLWRVTYQTAWLRAGYYSASCFCVSHAKRV